MGNAKWNRIFGCGVLTGASAFAFGVAAYIFRYVSSKSGAVMELGRPLIAPKPGTAFLMLGLYLVLGMVTIWLYASLRPSYGDGPKTAAVAGFAIWLVVSVVNLYLAVAGMFPVRTLVLPLATMLLGFVAAAQLGAASYRD